MRPAPPGSGTARPGRQPPVAIVGMAVLLPGAADLEAYWQNLVGGVDAITEVPEHRWDTDFYDPGAAVGAARADRIYCRRGGFVDGLAAIDPVRFGIMPGSVAGTEPDQLIALHVAASAIADAGGEARLPARDRVGVILGRGGYLNPGLVRLDQRVRGAAQLVRTLGELIPDLGPDQLEQVRAAFTEQLGPPQPEAVIGLVPNLAASRIANRLDLHGPAYTVDAACASALVAVDQGIGELASGRCDLVLAGGVHHCHDITLWSVFAQLRALSPSQRIRPFDRAADGLLIGEGTGVVVLKRLADAERDGDRIYAVVRGTGVASDGRSTSLLNPEPRGQVLAVRRAWEAAGLDPAEPGSLGLLEAHGTATPAGDRAELGTLRQVFGPPDGGPRAVLGSVKSMIGHAMPAAGIAGLVKAALAVHRGVLLPTLGCADPHPDLAGTRFRPIGAAEPWEPDDGAGTRRAVPRRAGVNAFGFGGINAHVLLEQYPGPAPAPRPRAPSAPSAPVAVREPEQVLRIIAATPADLAELLDQDDGVVRALGSTEPTITEPGVAGCRLGVVDPTPRRLATARKVVARGTAWRGRDDLWFSPEPLLRGRPGVPRLAFVFPGLEAPVSEAPASEAPASEAPASEAPGQQAEFSSGADDVAQHFGLPRPEVASSPEQVGRHGKAVIALGRLLDQALRRLQVRPDAVAGHSIGEWTAMSSVGMHAAGEVDEFLESFDPDALRVPDVAYTALSCGADRVAEALTSHPELVVSHENSPSQTIVCGPPGRVDELVRWFRRQHVLARVLPFRSGFHTPMLEPYLAPIRETAARFRLHPPAVPIWSATTAARYPEHEAEIRALFLRHLVRPVRFRALIEAMYAAGLRVFVQVGTGQLSTLISDTLRDREHLAVAAGSPRRGGLDQLRRVLTALWAEGGAPGALDRPATGPAGISPPQHRGQVVTLDLSAALVSLDAAPLALRPAGSGMSREPVAVPTPGPAAALSRLDRFANRFPLAAELGGVLQETAETAAALLDAGTGRAPGATRAAEPAVTAAAPGQRRTVLHVSLETMPYLRDHCFFQQRADWPDEVDRWPVVPATALVQHMIDTAVVDTAVIGTAEQAVPGRCVVAVHELRLNRWLVAEPPVEVPVSTADAGPDRIRVEIGSYCQAVVELGERYPADGSPPQPVDPHTERAPAITAEQLYRQRWMFHGPRYQGVTRLTAVGDRHIRGVFTTLEAPGALLDNVGQLLGYWVKSTQPDRPVLFPWRVRRIRFFGPHPPAGTTLDCLVQIRSLTDTTVEADVELTRGGRVWARIDGWQDHRFDIDAGTDAVGRFPQRRAVSRPQPGGWVLLFERWSGVAARDLVAHIHLSAAEQAEYQRCSPRLRRQWLLDRVAAKDAVRHRLWRDGTGPLFPAELLVSPDGPGRVQVSGLHSSTVPRCAVALAHCAEITVALARPCSAPERPDVGIAVVEIGGPDDRSVEDARFRAAKEAAKEAVMEAARKAAEDPGPGGFARTHRVRWAQISNPEPLPPRRYVVAWTTGAGHTRPENKEATQ